MDRREFLKNIAAAGIIASLGKHATAGKTAVSSSFNRPEGRNTLVFISDLHMNISSGYSWLSDHIQPLADFLSGLNTRTDVSELIILGDLVDNWVTPVDASPQSFSDILSDSINTPVISALQNICSNPDIKVTYVTGNHDMLNFEPENQNILLSFFPDMKIITNSPGYGSYALDNILWAEHGHRYCLFNAPDTWSRNNGNIPLGYFITRLAASRSLSDNQVHTTPEVLDYFMKLPGEELNRILAEYKGQSIKAPEKGIVEDALIIAVYEAISVWAGIAPWDRYIMNGLDNWDTNPLVASIGIIYDEIFSKWPDRQDIVGNIEAVLDDIGHLGGAANLLFEMPPWLKKSYPFTPGIVLFGHTHHAAMQYHAEGNGTIYANTGTWIDKSPMSWVEVIIDNNSNSRQYTVDLWFHGDSEPKQSASISVPADKDNIQKR